jgi:PqqD family protein of HPr-rel-A system
MQYKVELPGHFYDCGEESVVYFDLQTGDTHLVSDFAAHILRLLTGRAMGVDELVQLLLPDMEVEDPRNLATVIPDILEELVSLQIVEQG